MKNSTVFRKFASVVALPLKVFTGHSTSCFRNMIQAIFVKWISYQTILFPVSHAYKNFGAYVFISLCIATKRCLS